MGSIRIISGQWRGRKLPVLSADGLRPTTDRTKETLFNWLMQDIHGLRCIDAFAGSGSLGFEALSRGAKSVTFIEKNAAAVKQLKSNISLLKVNNEQAQVHLGEAADFFLQSPSQAYDLIFVDPPFGKGLVGPTLTKIVEKGWLTPTGLVYVEMEQPAPLAIVEPWQPLKTKETAGFCYQLLQLSPD
ncbi:16S rRNA (guanine(966)-N(2))-methyltransferase RsmD [Alteromonas sp. a30]|nr:16S rRNA (guanine(966)-N(2))-methyltransferase RsmD [Alteromonas sp. a30]